MLNYLNRLSLFLYLSLLYPLCYSYSFDGEKDFFVSNRIDEIQLENLRKINLSPSKICSDGIFVRRVWLDLAGTLPDYEETKNFISDKSTDKRAKLIDRVLESDNFAHYWALRWGDILRVKSEFPTNMWPNAVQAFNLWLWDSIRKNKPYDEFMRELICSSGSNFRDPQVNFYRSTPDRTAEGIAKIAALAFLCARIESWDENQRKEFSKLFSKIYYKKTDEWKEEIVMLNPEPFGDFEVKLPDGSILNIASNSDPRKTFAEWLVGPGKKWFSEAAVNRIWFWLFGIGIINEPDDFRINNNRESLLHRANPPSNPELLDFLGQKFIESKYDFKAILRLIANSATYQQSSVPPAGQDLLLSEKYFAVYKVRRLDAEIIADIFTHLSGKSPQYVSVIPEPFTYIPENLPTIALNDGSITSSFLETFGRSPRNTGLLTERNNNVNYSQRLYMLNSREIHKDICAGPAIKKIIANSNRQPQEIIKNLYLLLLSRYPGENELKIATQNLISDISAEPAQKDKKNRDGTKRKAIEHISQLAWMLINSDEFLFRH